MSQISRYILRQLFWWTVFVTVCLTCVVWLTQSLRFVEMIVNRGLSAPLFMYFTMLLLPTFLALILPIALFTAIMFTYNRLIVDNEMMVLRAAGLSHLDLAKPALGFAVLILVIGYALTTYFVPASYREFKDMQLRLRSSYTTVLLQEGVFNQIMKGVTVYVRTRTESGELIGIIIHDNRVPDKAVTMMAERGAIVAGDNGPRVVMVNGNRQEIQGEDGNLSLLYFDRYTFEIAGLTDAAHARWREPRERYLNELLFSLDKADEIWSFQQLRMEGHHRLASPLLTLAFAIVALAVLLSGDFNRRGQLARIVFAVIVVMALEAAVLGMKSMGENLPETMPLIYLSPLIVIGIGGYVLLNNRRFRRIPRVAPALEL